jgi:hypothetical protein
MVAACGSSFVARLVGNGRPDAGARSVDPGAVITGSVGPLARHGSDRVRRLAAVPSGAAAGAAAHSIGPARRKVVGNGNPTEGSDGLRVIRFRGRRAAIFRVSRIGPDSSSRLGLFGDRSRVDAPSGRIRFAGRRSSDLPMVGGAGQRVVRFGFALRRSALGASGRASRQPPLSARSVAPGGSPRLNPLAERRSSDRRTGSGKGRGWRDSASPGAGLSRVTGRAGPVAP